MSPVYLIQRIVLTNPESQPCSKVVGLVPAKGSELADGASPNNVTLPKLAHRLNAPLPIDLILSGIVTLAKPLQSKNAPLEIDVPPDENSTILRPEPLKF